MTSNDTSSAPGLDTAVLALMAIATGLAVASNYYAQPLLHKIGEEFSLSNDVAGLVVTVAQLAYAVGLCLIVPLGDMFERRNLIFCMILLSAGGLLVTALAPGFMLVLAGTALTALLSVVAQVLIPYAATLAGPRSGGKAVGTLMTGLLLGILLARTVAGVLSDLGGWRLVYWVAALLLLAMAFVLRRILPSHPVARAGVGYPELLASVARLFREEPLLRSRAMLGALVFMTLSVLWTSMTFLLANPPYGYSESTIGLFGLAGAVGALAAAPIGRQADRGQAARSTRIGLALLLASWLPLALAPHSIVALLAGILVLDLAVQAVHISNQSSLYRLRPEARSRLTAAYMTAFFVGGASGSLVSAWMYTRAGWNGVVAAGALSSLAALAYGTIGPGRRLPVPGPADRPS